MWQLWQMTGLEWNANLPPSPWCFQARVKSAYAAQVCWVSFCSILSMNRLVDRGNYDMVFVLKFTDWSYLLNRLFRSCLTNRWHDLSYFFFLMQRILNRLEHTVYVFVCQSSLLLWTHMFKPYAARKPLICIFQNIFHHKHILSLIFLGETEGFASEQNSAEHRTYYGSKAATGGILVMFYPWNESHSCGHF